MERKKILLPDSYQRAISSALSVVEELLLEMERLLEGKNPHRIFTKIENNIPGKNRILIKEEINNLWNQLKDIKDILDIKPETISENILISSRCGRIWEILCDLESKSLQRYGDPPERLPEFLDERVKNLINHIKGIAELTGKREESKFGKPEK